ncbi:hypothetical protein ALP27_01923 [Pseudomonas savastanoi pv. glycinea]|nr:hypothetical protein ALP27_01923 [Pseudomonas savastanoi pv. glycinea]
MLPTVGKKKMKIELQNSATIGNEGLWREHEKRFRDLVLAIWPSTPPGELASKISLSSLQAMIDGGTLTSEHEIGLKDYLSHLPGYDTPGLEKEAEHHHGFLTAHFHRLANGSEPASLS